MFEKIVRNWRKWHLEKLNKNVEELRALLCPEFKFFEQRAKSLIKRAEIKEKKIKNKLGIGTNNVTV